MTTARENAAKDARPEVRIEYESKQVLFASQFLVTGSDEELILDFSGGLINDQATGTLVLPIQSRVAMTPAGARRLISMLERALQQPGSREAPAESHAARLPKLRPAPTNRPD